MVYVVERYLPGLSRSDLLRGLSRLEQEAQREDTAAVRYLGSTIVLGDEACFCQFEGPSEAAVAEANTKAGLQFDRIVPALTVTNERRSPMSVSTSVPTTIEVKRSRLVGGAIAIAAVAAGLTWALLSFANDTGSGVARVDIERPVPVKITPSLDDQVFLRSISHTAQMQQAAAVLHALGLSPKEAEYIQAMTSLSPVEQAAAFGGPGAVLDALGLSRRDKQFVMGITSMTLRQQAAGFGGPGAMLDFLGLSPQGKKYVMGITRLTKAQQAAAFGR
jgi:hypothetical protein